jgi:hypothetical protein
MLDVERDQPYFPRAQCTSIADYPTTRLAHGRWRPANELRRGLSRDSPDAAFQRRPCSVPAHQARPKGPERGWREPRGGADTTCRGCAPHLASVEQFPGRSWPHVACWVVIVRRSRSSCRERRLLWSEPIDPAQDLGEQCSGHRHLGQLEHHVAAVAHDPGVKLGRRPVPVPGMAADRRSPAVRAATSAFPRFGSFTLNSRYGG